MYKMVRVEETVAEKLEMIRDLENDCKSLSCALRESIRTWEDIRRCEQVFKLSSSDVTMNYKEWLKLEEDLEKHNMVLVKQKFTIAEMIDDDPDEAVAHKILCNKEDVLWSDAGDGGDYVFLEDYDEIELEGLGYVWISGDMKKSSWDTFIEGHVISPGYNFDEIKSNVDTNGFLESIAHLDQEDRIAAIAARNK